MQNCAFLCSLDNFLQENVIVYIFGTQKIKMALIWKKKKKGYFWPTFNIFLVTRGRTQNSVGTYTSLTYIHLFRCPNDCFCHTNLAKITNLSCLVSLWCDSWCWLLFAPFCNIRCTLTIFYSTTENSKSNVGL